MRIKDYTEASTITDDDYVIIDSVNREKPVRIKATYFGTHPEPGPDYLYNWDFTKSSTDSVEGVTVTLNNAQRQDDRGLYLNSGTSEVLLNIDDITPAEGEEIVMEFEMGDMELMGSSGHSRLFMWTDTTGFIYRAESSSNKYWSSYTYDAWQIFNNKGLTSFDFFSNSTFKVIFTSDTKLYFYKNDVMIAMYDYSDITNYAVNFRQLGSSYGGVDADIYIKSLKIYKQEPSLKYIYLYNWDFTESYNDIMQKKAVSPTSGYEPTRNNTGLHFTAEYQQATVNRIDLRGRVVEVDMGEVDYKGGNLSTTCQFLQVPITDTSTTSDTRGYSLLAYQGGIGWGSYGGDAYNSLNNRHWSDVYSDDLAGSTTETLNLFSNKKLKLDISLGGGKTTLYIDDELKGTITGTYAVNTRKQLAFNNSNAYYPESTSQARFYDSTIKALRVAESNTNYNYAWDLTQSLIDSSESIPIDVSGATQGSSGLVFDGASDYATVNLPLRNNYIYEFDIASMSKTFDSTVHGRFILPDTNNGFIWRKQTQQWELYQDGWYADNSESTLVTDSSVFNRKTMKMLWDSNNKLCIYADNVLVYRCSLTNALAGLSDTFMIGSSGGQSFFNMTITAIRVYRNTAKEV